MIAKTHSARHPLFPAPPEKKLSIWGASSEISSIEEICRAKINLFLHVTGKRPDGYHNLQSWVAFAEPTDILIVREAKQPYFFVDGPFAKFLPSAQNNLVLNALKLMAERHGKKQTNFHIELRKNLPVGSGMGSGSADVAGLLRALQKLWGFEWHADDALWLAKNLGADVPVCLAGKSCMMTSIGEKLHAMPPMPPDCHVVLVYPDVGVSTPSAFQSISAPYTPTMTLNTAQLRDVIDLVKILHDTRNDFMQSAMSGDRQIIAAFRKLTGQPGCLLARITGSGSTSFGIFADQETAQSAAKLISESEPNWWVRATRLV